MINRDKDLIEASKHYRIAECGGLARISTPYEMNAKTKMGLDFDNLNTGYMKFHHRHDKSSKRFTIYSHRMIYFLHYGETPEFVDHINRNTLDNSISNLRASTKNQNGANRKSSKNSSSKFLGVSWSKVNNQWRASICVEGVDKYLGSFTNEVEASEAYNIAALIHHGEFAALNSPNLR